MQGNGSTRNIIVTPHHSQCRICHIAGYSNNCSFFSTGVCTVMSALKGLKQEVPS